ncbi:MAG TPA: sterol desaturase family protein, partial [Croceibacterium sp.]|nr:sterol desaturase family protein [Croceibacterium sp.]
MFDLEVFSTVAVVALVFVPLEALLPARRRPDFSLARYRTDLLHALLGGLVIRAGTAWLLAILLLPAFGGPTVVSHWPLWLQFVTVLLLSDLMFWLAHRLYHAVPLLWKFHRVHHSSEHLDWLAAFRVHPVDQIVNASIIALPALLLEFSPAAVLLYALLYKWHAILLHSNVDVSFGPLGW